MGKRKSRVQLLSRDDFSRMRLGSLDAAINGRASNNGTLFIGRYDAGQMSSFLEKTGFRRVLAAKGYTDTRLVIMNDPSGISTLRIYGGNISPLDLLIDLKASEQRICRAETNDEARFVYDVVLVEWFQSRDVRVGFNRDADRLPGQDHPGLGALGSFFHLMKLVGADISRDAFMAVPDHLHAAFMYAGTFRFLDPSVEGTIRAIRRDLSSFTLSDIAWAHVLGAIRDARTLQPFVYRPARQVYPISRRMTERLRSRPYVSAVKQAYRYRSFLLDQDVLEKGRSGAMQADL